MSSEPVITPSAADVFLGILLVVFVSLSGLAVAAVVAVALVACVGLLVWSATAVHELETQPAQGILLLFGGACVLVIELVSHPLAGLARGVSTAVPGSGVIGRRLLIDGAAATAEVVWVFVLITVCLVWLFGAHLGALIRPGEQILPDLPSSLVAGVVAATLLVTAGTHVMPVVSAGGLGDEYAHGNTTVTVSEVRIGDPSELGDSEAVRNPIDLDESQTLVLVHVEATKRGPGGAELPAREHLLYADQQPVEALVYRELRGSNPLVGPSLEPVCEWRGYDLCYRAVAPEGRERETTRRWLIFVVPEQAVGSEMTLQLQVGQVAPEWRFSGGNLTVTAAPAAIKRATPQAQPEPRSQGCRRQSSSNRASRPP